MYSLSSVIYQQKYIHNPNVFTELSNIPTEVYPQPKCIH